MLESRLSRVLLALGAGVGLLGVAVWALELQVNLPDWIVRVAMLKLTLIASVGLLAGGAVVGRHARQRLLSETPPGHRIGEGAAEPLTGHRGSITPEGVERRPSDPPLR